MSKKKPVKKSKERSLKPNKAKAAKQSSWSLFQSSPVLEQDELYKKIFWIAFCVISLVILVMAIKTGVNEDDKFHYGYSKVLANYYSTFGEDKGALNVKSGLMHFYGGFIDTSTGVINKILGFEQSDAGYHTVRHLFLALIGLLGMLATGLIGRRIGGWRMGVLALLILFLTPRFTGHAVINPRDIPFASGYIIAVYFMIRFFGEIPKVSWKTAFGLAAGIGIAMGARSGALLLVAYFGLFGLIHLYFTFKDSTVNKDKLLLKYLIPGGVSVLAGYVIALLFWPYGLAKPIANVLNSIKEFSNYKTVLRMLFQGDMQWSSDIAPTTYISTWFLIALPIILLIGVLLFLIFSRSAFKKYNRFYIGMIVFVFLFPLAYIIYKQSNLYAGMRHLLFVVPPLAILSALGWESLICKFEQSKKPLYLASVGAFGILALLPLSHIATNFTSSYVYFNSVSGGVKGALGNYELDYWGVSIKQAVDWMEDEGLFEGEKELLIASNSDFVLKQYVKKFPNVKTRYARFRERYERTWDYAIFINHFADGAHLRTGKYLDNNVIKTIGKGDTPFCMVYDNTGARKATNGFIALKENKFVEAERLFSEEVKENPNNENAFYGLGKTYFNQQKFAQAEQAFDQVLALNPESQVALTYGGLTALNTGKQDKGLDFFTKAEKLNARDANALYYQGLIYSRKGNDRQAIDKLKASIQINPTMRQTFQLLIQLYEKQGDNQQANYYRQLMSQYAK